MKPGLLIIFIILLWLCSCDQTPEYPWTDLRKLQGEWFDKERNYHEIWELKEDKLLGTGMNIEYGDTIIREFLRIAKKENQTVYYAKPLDQNRGKWISFPLQKRKNHEFHFENRGHDFPNKIIYNILSDSLVTINVENTKSDIGFELNMKKISK